MSIGDVDRCPMSIRDGDGYQWRCLLDRGDHEHVYPLDLTPQRERWRP